MAKILIIEDEKFLVKMLTRALEAKKHEVIVALNGKGGLEKALKEKPDFILLDIMLPDIDGTEVLKKLKANEETADIPVIVATNLGNEDTVSKIVKAGGTEYIVKSDWKLDDIVKKIEDSL